MEDKRQSFVTCSCGAHAVSISSDKEEDRHDIYLAFWNYGWDGKGKMPWSYRLRAIWRILTVGYDSDDSVVLNPTEVGYLVQALKDHAK